MVFYYLHTALFTTYFGTSRSSTTLHPLHLAPTSVPCTAVSSGGARVVPPYDFRFYLLLLLLLLLACQLSDRSWPSPASFFHSDLYPINYGILLPAYIPVQHLLWNFPLLHYPPPPPPGPTSVPCTAVSSGGARIVPPMIFYFFFFFGVVVVVVVVIVACLSAQRSVMAMIIPLPHYEYFFFKSTSGKKMFRSPPPPPPPLERLFQGWRKNLGLRRFCPLSKHLGDSILLRNRFSG